MRVLTLSQGAVDWQGRELARRLVNEYPGGFDLMVGVRRGGVFVADAVERYLPESFCRVRTNIKLQRPSTRGKGARLAAVLGNTPLWMLNSARIIESYWLQLRDRMSKKKEASKKFVVDGGELPPLGDGASILLVDDAIDTGATISAVRKVLRDRYGDVRCVVATITVTTDSPALDADLCTYHDRTLVRFPWSLDYKKMMP